MLIEPKLCEMLEDDYLLGYREVLRLYIFWENGILRFFDPTVESYLRTYAEENARVAELEEKLRRLSGE